MADKKQQQVQKRKQARDPFFVDFFDDSWFRPSQRLWRNFEHEIEQWQPSCDIAENKDSYSVHAELPGVKKEDITVNYDHESHVLTISGETNSEKKVDHEKFHKVERRTGKFERKFVLPANANGDSIVANMKDGVLEVSVPKLAIEEKPKVKNIQIQ